MAAEGAKRADPFPEPSTTFSRLCDVRCRRRRRPWGLVSWDNRDKRFAQALDVFRRMPGGRTYPQPGFASPNSRKEDGRHVEAAVENGASRPDRNQFVANGDQANRQL